MEISFHKERGLQVIDLEGGVDEMIFRAVKVAELASRLPIWRCMMASKPTRRDEPDLKSSMDSNRIM